MPHLKTFRVGHMKAVKSRPGPSASSSQIRRSGDPAPERRRREAGVPRRAAVTFPIAFRLRGNSVDKLLKILLNREPPAVTFPLASGAERDSSVGNGKLPTNPEQVRFS